MLHFKEYVKPKTLEEAYNLLNSKNSEILGGAAFLRLSNRKIDLAIDLIDAGLDYVKESESIVEIGSMVTISAFEENPALSTLFDGFLKKVAETILSFQMRNIITIGGTLYPKYGFSDLITALLVLNTDIYLYKMGKLPLEEFLKTKVHKDILEKIAIKKENLKVSFQYIRNSEYDFSILNVAVSKGEKIKIAVGARPGVAVLARNAMEHITKKELNEKVIEETAKIVSEEIDFSDDIKASKEFRKKVCVALVKRALLEVM
ncbi:FAD binding domain-containing protein [Thermosipho atlanticus]|uniref:CO or xanthine dehydrogenase, FAD-binding subunit n=1 Tax=Thermosipho atlanticus DSM 15807 TaxID=1123380 RepID=A0A1M5QQQ8_9BACT|nr:FAD binding domain-containing protein [Thermosipho atlanticus]SHH16467.1 CO or xanthine dehydrogenase, FAD-binding subunit [Thermosipho atlanticus DSM 15807]